jgi:hypothetical protein
MVNSEAFTQEQPCGCARGGVLWDVGRAKVGDVSCELWVSCEIDGAWRWNARGAGFVMRIAVRRLDQWRSSPGGEPNPDPLV